MLIYYSFIHSHLNYCISSWGGASASALSPLIKLQKKAVRIITHNNIRTHSELLFTGLCLLQLNDMHKMETAKLVYKLSNKSFHSFRSNLGLFIILNEIHSHYFRRKSETKYFLPRVNATQTQKLLINKGTKIWNQIPKEIREIKFLNFKKELNNVCISQYSFQITHNIE